MENKEKTTRLPFFGIGRGPYAPRDLRIVFLREGRDMVFVIGRGISRNGNAKRHLNALVHPFSNFDFYLLATAVFWRLEHKIVAALV